MKILFHLAVCGVLAPPLVDTLGATFENVASEAGLAHDHYRADLPGVGDIQFRMSGGAAAADYDNDGWIDLYFTRLDGPDLLYRNLGNGTFQDVTVAVFGEQHLANVCTNGCAWADIDNDGFLDLFTAFGSLLNPEDQNSLIPAPNVMLRGN